MCSIIILSYTIHLVFMYQNSIMSMSVFSPSVFIAFNIDSSILIIIMLHPNLENNKFLFRTNFVFIYIDRTREKWAIISYYNKYTSVCVRIKLVHILINYSFYYRERNAYIIHRLSLPSFNMCRH